MSNPLVLTFALVGTWNLLSVFISFALVDRLGRRPLMLGALFFMFLGAGLMSLAYEAMPDHKAAPAIIAMILFIGAFECGPGPLFFLMAVEVSRQEKRKHTHLLPIQACRITSRSASLFFLCVCVSSPRSLLKTFPVELRDPALSFTQSFCWICSIVVTFGFPVLNDALGPAATFLIFACNCIVGFVLIWWKVPEPHGSSTSQKTLKSEDEETVNSYQPL